jgi:hypothetical protein
VKAPLTTTITTTNGLRNKQLPFTISFTNTYTTDITVSDVTITTKDAFTPTTVSGMRITAQRITVDDFTLKKGENKNVTSVVTATTPGRSELVITGSVDAFREDSFKELARYSIYAPEIILEPVVSQRTVALRVLNADDVTHSAIAIDWGDGAQTVIDTLNSGADKPLTHTYPVSSPARVTISARYQDGTVATTKSEAVSLIGTTGTAPSEPATPAPTPLAPTQPAPVEPVPSEPAPVPSDPTSPTETQPVTPDAPSTDAPKDERGVITKILDWLESLFG